jgi:hypothetical protein
VKIVPDKKYPDLYRIQWPNGDISVKTPNPEYKGGHWGFYNKTRAKEHLYRKGIENYTKGVTYKASVAQ